MREVENIARDEVRSAAALRVKLDRANKVVLRAVTSEDAKRVLTNTDVIDVICGPLQTKIRQLQQQLKAEKLKTKHVLRHQQKLEKELAYQKVKTSRRVERLETELEETKSSLLRQNAADLQKYKQHLIQEAERHEKLLKTSQGLSGTKLGSDQYHTDNPYDCRRYFGFPSWQELKVYVKCMFAVTCCVSKAEFSTLHRHLCRLHQHQTGIPLGVDLGEVRASIWFMSWFVQFSDLELVQLAPEFADWLRGTNEVSKSFGSLSGFVREIWRLCQTHRKAPLNEVFTTVVSVCKWLGESMNLQSSVGEFPIRTPGPVSLKASNRTPCKDVSASEEVVMDSAAKSSQLLGKDRQA